MFISYVLRLILSAVSVWMQLFKPLHPPTLLLLPYLHVLWRCFVWLSFLSSLFGSHWLGEKVLRGNQRARKQTLFTLNKNNIAHNVLVAPFRARLPMYSISLTTKTVSSDLASDVHSKLDTSVWLSITSGLFVRRAAPLFHTHSQHSSRGTIWSL